MNFGNIFWIEIERLTSWEMKRWDGKSCVKSEKEGANDCIEGRI